MPAMDTLNYYWNDRLVSKNVYMALLRGLRNTDPVPEAPDFEDLEEDQFDPEDDTVDLNDEPDYEPDDYYDEGDWEKAQDRYENWLFRDHD